MIDPDLKDLWTPAGLILGFQVTLFKWRLERESEVGDKGDIPWLVPSDYISILGMFCFVFGVVLLPVSGAVGSKFARWAFGLGTLSSLPKRLDSRVTTNSTIEPRSASSSGFLRRKKLSS